MTLTLQEKKLRVSIYNKINKIKDKDILQKIYQIILDNNEKHNVNINGVFFDIYLISKKSFSNIETIVNEYTKINKKNTKKTKENNYSFSYSEEHSETIEKDKIKNTSLPIKFN